MIKEIHPADCIAQIEALSRLNWDETGFDFPLKINERLYVALHEMGVLVCLGAFDEGELVGYSTAFVGPHAFNPDVIACESNALFLHPAHRAGQIGGRLMFATEQTARRKGATHMLWHTRAGTDLADVLKRRGYKPADEIVMRAL